MDPNDFQKALTIIFQFHNYNVKVKPMSHPLAFTLGQEENAKALKRCT